MNTATLALVDPALAQIQFDDRRRKLRNNEVRGDKTFATDFDGATLQCDYIATQSGGRGLPVEHDVKIDGVRLVNADGTRSVSLPLDFLDMTDYAHEIELELDAEQFDHA